jgi:glycosyltransferase involved in cell wall biosynthesis
MDERAHHKAATGDGKPSEDQSWGKVVLQVIPSLYAGGVEQSCLDVASAVQRAGGTAIVASAGGPLVETLRGHGVRHIELQLDTRNPMMMRVNAQRLVELIRENRVDLVHARSRTVAWSAKVACEELGLPLVTTVHILYEEDNPQARGFNAVMAGGDRVIAISEYVAQQMREDFGLGPDRLRVVPRGIDLNVFSPEQVDPDRLDALSRAWHLAEGEPVVFLPARLRRGKGHEVLLAALGRLGDRPYRCQMVGASGRRPTYRRELDSWVERAGLAGKVAISDYCSDMPAAYLLSDVVVVPSTAPEAFGRVIVEAQAMGRPVVASDVGALRELVVPGETGWLVPPGDPDALAAALTDALALDADHRAALAERAKAHASSRYRVDSMTDGVLAVYRELLDGPQGSAAGPPQAAGA